MKIEIGKRYVTRDGRVTGPVGSGPLNFVYVYVCDIEGEYITFTDNGQVSIYGKSRHDLVREYNPVPPLKRWIQAGIVAVALMLIGAVINSFVYRVERVKWQTEETERLITEWQKVGAAYKKVDSITNEAWAIHGTLMEIKERETKP